MQKVLQSNACPEGSQASPLARSRCDGLPQEVRALSHGRGCCHDCPARSEATAARSRSAQR
eukprot:980257-Lingulodinium_polyedra.AAC.1